MLTLTIPSLPLQSVESVSYVNFFFAAIVEFVKTIGKRQLVKFRFWFCIVPTGFTADEYLCHLFA